MIDVMDAVSLRLQKGSVPDEDESRHSFMKSPHNSQPLNAFTIHPKVQQRVAQDETADAKCHGDQRKHCSRSSQKMTICFCVALLTLLIKRAPKMLVQNVLHYFWLSMLRPLNDINRYKAFIQFIH
jgi:hypothetical protein